MIQDRNITELPLHYYALFRTHTNTWFVNTDNGIIVLNPPLVDLEQQEAATDFKRSILFAAYFRLVMAATTDTTYTRFGTAEDSIVNLMAIQRQMSPDLSNQKHYHR